MAEEALRGVEEGRFAVVPEEWRETVVCQREQLVRGEVPASLPP